MGFVKQTRAFLTMLSDNERDRMNKDREMSKSHTNTSHMMQLQSHEVCLGQVSQAEFEIYGSTNSWSGLINYVTTENVSINKNCLLCNTLLFDTTFIRVLLPGLCGSLYF